MVQNGTLVKGKTYAAFIMKDEDFCAKPLLAGILKLDHSEGLSYKMMQTAAQTNGYFFWTTKLIHDDREPRELTMEMLSISFRKVAEDRKSRFEKK